MNKKNELLIRVYAVLMVFAVVALVMVWRVFDIAIVDGEKWRTKGASQYLKWETMEGERGDIMAVDGSLLLTSNQFFEIRMDPVANISDFAFSQKIDSLAYCLAKYSDISKSRKAWKNLLVENRRAYKIRKKPGSKNIKIANNLDFDTYKQFSQFPLLRRGVQGGFKYIRKLKRDRPYGNIASRTLGLDRENNDKIGLEAYYDQYLSGDSISVLMRKLSGGNWVPMQELGDIDTEKGMDIRTTLDVRLCEIVHKELQAGVEKHAAKAGVAILMEVETGAIKAMSNLQRLESGKYAEVYNFSIAESGEPGSTFKAATALALLEEGVSMDKLVDLEGGKTMFYDQPMRDSERHGERVKSFHHAFVTSSNIGMAKLAVEEFGSRIKAVKFINYLEQFGLSERTGIDIPGESKPYIKHPKENSEKWYGTTIPWMAHGYELELSPIQTLTFYNAVANNGTLMKPYLVSEIVEEGKQKREFTPKVINPQIASNSSIGKLQKMLEDVVRMGTAKRLKSDQFDFAGKTGTSSVNYNAKDGSKKEHNASFAGYFPAKNPKYSLIVVVYEPEGQYYGGAVAGPVFKGIAENVHIAKRELSIPVEEGDNPKFASLGNKSPGYSPDIKKVLEYAELDYKVKTKSNWITAQKRNGTIELSKKKFKKDVVPDVRGMGLRDAVYALENMGLNVEVHGVGKVSKQTLLPGTLLKGQEIELYLN